MSDDQDRDVLARISLEWLADRRDQDLYPMQSARGIRELERVYGWNQVRIAREINANRAWVSRIRMLLLLPTEVQSLIDSGVLGWTKGHAIRKLGDVEMVEFAREIVERDLTKERIDDELKARFPHAAPAAVEDEVESAAVPNESGRGGAKPYRLTVRQYERMVDAGVLPENHDVELLAGLLVDKTNRYEPQGVAIAQLGDDLRRLIGTAWVVREEKPLAVGHLWRPIPDLAVVLGSHSRYGYQVPFVSDIGFIAEAPDTSNRYQKDRNPKWTRYAAAGVPSNWIINLPKRVLEVYSDPEWARSIGLLSGGQNLPERRPSATGPQLIARSVVSSSAASWTDP